MIPACHSSVLSVAVLQVAVLHVAVLLVTVLVGPAPESVGIPAPISRLDGVSQPSSAEVPAVPHHLSAQEHDLPGQAPAEAVADPVPVLLRRAPRYWPFALSGMVVGALALLVAGGVAVRDKGFATPMVPLDLVLVGIVVGGLVGASAALLVERRRPR